YLHVTGHGNIHWSDDDLKILRRWLEQGGFLHVDDNYGLDESFRREIVRLFPDHPLVEVPLDHPIYHLVYDFPHGCPKIHEHDGKPAQGFGIFLKGRLVVYYTYQSDLGDGWEDESVHHDPPEKHEAALRMGVNLFAYAVGYGGGPGLPPPRGGIAWPRPPPRLPTPRGLGFGLGGRSPLFGRPPLARPRGGCRGPPGVSPPGPP